MSRVQTDRVLPWVVAIIGAVTIAATAWNSPDNVAFALVWAGYLVVGLVVVHRRPGHRLGWLMLATGSASTMLISLTGPPAVESVLHALSAWPWLSLCAIVTLFPDGVARDLYDRILVAVIVGTGLVFPLVVLPDPARLESGRPNPFGLDSLPWLTPVSGAGFLAVPLLLLAAVVGDYRKWRRSDGVVHNQYSCLLCGTALTAFGFVVGFATDGTVLASLAWSLSLVALPASMGVAILRFRLFEIDRIVRRTTTYAIVTGVVLAVYALVVTAVSRLLPVSSDLAVAAATLTAAGLARPLLDRVRQAVDRRFDRSRLDARRTVDAFAHRTQQVVDNEMLSRDLTAVVKTSLSPATVALWLPTR